MWMGFYADEVEVAGRRESEVGVRGEGRGENIVFAARLAHESVCLMQEGVTQNRDCLSQTRRGATQPSREHVKSSSTNDTCGCDFGV